MPNKLVVKCEAPATIANLGPGFDVLGVALEEPRDEVTLLIEEGPLNVTIDEVSGLDPEHVPRDPSRNTSAIVVREVLRKAGVEARVSVRIKKRVPIASGLGSSGASAAAAAYAVYRGLNLKLKTQELVEAAAKAEEAAAGAPHADNVAPSLLGGACIIQSYKPLVIHKLNVNVNARIVIALIKSEVRDRKTEAARKVLPKTIPLEKMVMQTASLSTLIAGIAVGDPALIGYGMTRDYVIEDARSKIYPWLMDFKKKAVEEGAYGCCLCGAGPSIAALVKPSLTSRIEELFSRLAVEYGLDCRVFTTSFSSIGARVIQARVS